MPTANRIAFGVALLAAALGSPIAPRGMALAADEIAVGLVYNTSGTQAFFGAPSLNGAQLAIERINAAGGVLGDRLTPVVVEGDSDLEHLHDRTAKLLAQHPELTGVVGLSDPQNVLAAAPLVAAEKKVFITSGATLPTLPAEVPTYLFLACFGDNVQAAAGAEWAFETLGARAALVLYDEDRSYTLALRKYFIERFTQLGGKISSSAGIKPGADGLQVPEPGDVDLVFVSVEDADDATRVIALLRSAGYQGPVLGGDGYDSGSAWAAHPDANDIYFTTHVFLSKDNPNRQVGEFIDAYTAAFPDAEPTAFSALGYDAIGVLAAGIERAGSAAPADLLAGLSGLEGYEGVTGTIGFTRESRIPSKSVTIMKVQSGALAFVEQRMPDGVPAP